MYRRVLGHNASNVSERWKILTPPPSRAHEHKKRHPVRGEAAGAACVRGRFGPNDGGPLQWAVVDERFFFLNIIN